MAGHDDLRNPGIPPYWLAPGIYRQNKIISRPTLSFEIQPFATANLLNALSERYYCQQAQKLSC